MKAGGQYFTLESYKRAPWMEIALQEAMKAKGAKEEQNPLYQMAKEYHNEGGHVNLDPRDDTYGPWCASFVNWCLKEAGFNYTKSPSSQSFRDHSKFKKINRPIYGAITVFKNKGKGGGHVNFIYGKTNDGRLLCIGGNQGQTIKFSPYTTGGKQYLVGYYIPVEYENQIKKGDYLNENDIYNNADELNNMYGIETKTKENESTN